MGFLSGYCAHRAGWILTILVWLLLAMIILWLRATKRWQVRLIEVTICLATFFLLCLIRGV